MNREQVLSEAERLISNDRAEQYGDAEDNFQRIATLWTMITGHQFTAPDVAGCMIALKLARLSTSTSKADTWIDIAGYAALGAEIAEAN